MDASARRTFRWLRVRGASVVRHLRGRLSGFLVFQGGGYNLLRIFLGLLLLTAAGLKAHQLATQPLLGCGLRSTPDEVSSRRVNYPSPSVAGLVRAQPRLRTRCCLYTFARGVSPMPFESIGRRFSSLGNSATSAQQRSVCSTGSERRLTAVAIVAASRQAVGRRPPRGTPRAAPTGASPTFPAQERGRNVWSLT
jgi:hypothetical protein